MKMSYRVISQKTAEWLGMAASVSGGWIAVDGPRIERWHGRGWCLDLIMCVPSTSNLAGEGRPLSDDELAEYTPDLISAGYRVVEESNAGNH